MNFLARLFLYTLILCILSEGHASAGQANLFIYHRFGEARFPSTNISLDNFARHLEILQEQDVRVISLGDLVQLLRSGTELRENYAVLTVDDGYRSFLTGAVPLLKRYGYPATLFVNTASVGGGNYLTWDEIKRISSQGIEIGCHSATHPHMVDSLPGESPAEWQRRLRTDLDMANKAFSSHLSKAPKLFAYPYGEYSPAVQALVQSAGFLAAVGQQSGVVTTSSDLFALPRFPMGGSYASPQQFREKLRMHHLPVEIISPLSPIVKAENPPVLRFRLSGTQVNPERLQCFVPGQPQAKISRDPGAAGVYRVSAREALVGRRSKYTLTAPLKQGGWAWFSQQWIRVDVPEGATRAP